MTHSWFNAKNISALFISIPRNPDWCEVRIRTTSDNLNPGEETVEDVYTARSSEDGDKDNTVLSYTVIE